MCCGCAAAVSDRAGAARDLVAPLCPDFVFRCGDIGALAELMKKATANPARLKDLGRAALAYIQTWSPERNIGATVDAIRMATSRLQPNSITAPSDSVAHKSAVPASQKSQE
jgi:glycosyltransferase involved in cell wall biosynthesis